VYDSIEKMRDVLEKREKETYLIQRLKGVHFNGDLTMLFDVREVSDDLKILLSGSHEKEFKMNREVFRHFCEFLRIPSKVYDYFQGFSGVNDGINRKILKENESENLQILFNDFMGKELKGNKSKKLYLTSFRDVFGDFPRVIHSSRYVPIEDLKVLEMLEKKFQSFNRENSDKEYKFMKGFLTPYISEFEYIDEKHEKGYEFHEQDVGEAIKSGIVIRNSETKHASFTYQVMILRLMCTNGLFSSFMEDDLKIRHDAIGFHLKVQKGFSRIMELEKLFMDVYLKSLKYQEPLSLNWNDLYNIPSRYLSLRRREKQELIELAQKENYSFSPHGILQALTYKSTHEVKNEEERNRYNRKALQILDNLESLQTWKPINLSYL